MLPHPIHLSPALPLHFVVESAEGFDSAPEWAAYTRRKIEALSTPSATIILCSCFEVYGLEGQGVSADTSTDSKHKRGNR
jgi:hypothetical protein